MNAPTRHRPEKDGISHDFLKPRKAPPPLSGGGGKGGASLATTTTTNGAINRDKTAAEAMLRRLKEELRAREGEAGSSFSSSAVDGRSTNRLPRDEAIRPSAEESGDFDDSDDPTLFPAAVASETESKRQRVESDHDDSNGKTDEEEEDLLKKELEKVKKERERAKASSSSTAPLASLFLPDPSGGEGGGDTTIKKKWNEDVIFRASSNAASVFETKKKEFVNDSTHSEFHKRFMKKYVR